MIRPARHAAPTPAPGTRAADFESEPGADTPLEILRSVRRIEIRSRRLVQDLFSGSYHAVFKGRGIEFSEVREYVPGDDIRSIDWNVTARMDHPFVKQFHEEREQTVVLVVDASASMRFGSTSRGVDRVAAETAAIIAFSAASNQDKVGLLLFGSRLERWVPPRKGRSHLLRIVREILFHPARSRGTSIGEAVERATRMLRRRSLIFLISDFLQDDAYGDAVAIAARKHEVIPIVLIDPRSESLPAVGLVDVDDLETGERRLIDTDNRGVRERWAAAATARRAAREGVFHRAGIVGIEIDLAGDTVQPLVEEFRRRERWRAAGR